MMGSKFMMDNKYYDEILGFVIGDALGVPVEFFTKEALAKNPVTGMIGYGTHNQPEGTWSDDSSMMFATLDSLSRGYDPRDMMERMSKWLFEGKYTPFGEVFDVGITCRRAILKYASDKDIYTCGCGEEGDNGNGSLMRILPVCLYLYDKQKCKEASLSDEQVIQMIHEVSALTHAHIRSKIACGLYYFMVRAILDKAGTLKECLQKGITDGFDFYENHLNDKLEMKYFENIRNLTKFEQYPATMINGTGYVVATMETVVWCLIHTVSYADSVLMAVNFGDDTDTTAAITGGLAGLYYGVDAIPEEWKENLK